MQYTLSNLIKKEYLKSIIFPLVLIESMLLIAYFWSNSFVNDASQHALIEETKVNIKEISRRSATIVDNEFGYISKTTALFQKEHEAFFQTYNPLHVEIKNDFYKILENGVITNTQKEKDSCTLFFSSIKKEVPQRLQKAIASEKLDYFYNATLKTNENIAQVYFNSYDSMNRLCPFMADALEQYTLDMDIPTFNFYYLADKEHNPEKKVVWTDAYLDPAGLGWMISAIAPVYKNDFLEGVVGIDVTIDKLITNILSIQLPYKSSAMLVDKNGNILAMDALLEPLFGLKELKDHVYDAPIEKTITKPKDFNLFENKNTLSKHLTSMIEKDIALSHFDDKISSMLITQNTIPQTGWSLIILLDEASLLAPSKLLKEKTYYIGYLALVLMAVFYLVFLMIIINRSRNFAKLILLPLQNLIQATNALKGKMIVEKLEHCNIVEIDTLLDNFSSMGKELQELYASMDKKIKMGILENIETQKVMIYQSRLAQMGEMISMIAHQWRQPLGSISTVTASIKLKQSLKKFDLETPNGREEHIEFLNTAIGKIENYINFLTNTIDDFRNFFKPEQEKENITLGNIITNTVKIIGKSLEVHNITLQIDNRSSREFLTYGAKMTQVLINLLKNAQDAIIEKKISYGEIWIRTYEDGEDLVLEVEDNAGGIDVEIIEKIFDPYFSTKKEKNGTGLGLYMSKTIIEEHVKGSLKVINTKVGAKFIIGIKGRK